MKRKLVLAVAVAMLLGLMMTQTALGDPYSPYNARPVAIGVSGEPTLQSVLDTLWGGPGWGSTATSQSNVGMWQICCPGSPDILNTLVIEHAGNAGSNSVGIFSDQNLDDSDGWAEVIIFNGLAGVGQKAVLDWDDNPGFLTIYQVGGPAGSVNTGVFAGISPSLFGFYLDATATGNGRHYSVDHLNAGGPAQVLAFQQPGGASWALGFEDQYGGDRDFQDAVLKIESVNPVPEPASLLLLGSGLLAFAGLARRKLVKKG